MVGGVKPGAFENDPYRCINLAQCFFVTFRAARKNRVIKTLQALEPNAAILASICVYRHYYLSVSLP